MFIGKTLYFRFFYFICSYYNREVQFFIRSNLPAIFHSSSFVSLACNKMHRISSAFVCLTNCVPRTEQTIVSMKLKQFETVFWTIHKIDTLYQVQFISSFFFYLNFGYVFCMCSESDNSVELRLFHKAIPNTIQYFKQFLFIVFHSKQFVWVLFREASAPFAIRLF